MPEALVFDAIRTPRGKGKSNGSLHATKPVDLVVGLMHETLARNESLDPNRVDDVVLGVVSPVGDQGADIAKTAAIKAGLPDTVAGVQLNRFCASGLEAVNIAAQKVASGWEDLVFAGGVESMSRVPMGSDGGAWAMDPETNYDTSFVPQGIGADLIATVEEFSREDVDTYATRSQERAARAEDEGRFKNSVIPVEDLNGHTILDKDEFIRRGTTVETLGGLKPSFAAMGEMGGFDAVALQKYHWIEKIDHVHTPGNSSGIVDGASLLTIGNEKTGSDLGLKPRARILATAVSGADPTIMLTGPAPASKKALEKAGITKDDLDLVEINEAFAAVVLRFVRDMDLDMEKVNVNGGAIAMGHPLGATGGMILGTLIDELHRTGGRYGLATLCVGGGMGIATVIEAISMSTIRYDKGDDGIVILTLDDPNQSANTMNRAYGESIRETVERLESEKDSIKGVVITSAKKTFFAGGDLNDLKQVTPETADEFAGFVREGKAILRRLETLGVPVVAAINGAALGGGLEICLACHHRVIVDDSKAVVGFPEVQLGLLPGAGGVVRSVRMLGIVQALMGLLMQGQRLKPAAALEMGVVDEIVATRDDLVPAAKKWIEAQGEDFAGQPWDQKGYKIPGGTPSTPALAQNLPAFPANLRKQIKGANYPAPHHIMAVAVESAQVDVDNAFEIEGRYFVDLATGQVAKNMIQAFFFDLQAVNGSRGRPEDVETFASKKVVVLGAGMMGAAIAYVCAKSGIEVVLKDVSQEAADRGKAYSEKLVAKGVERGKVSQEKGDALLARITATDDATQADGADLVIEAVFEDPKVKEAVFAEIEPHLAEGALLGSNTSTLPITGLAEYVSRPNDFIGLHFFSPVDKMPLLEIIKGEKTADETLYRALDVAKQIGKVPIVVNDSRGFYTSRVIGTFINEGIAMLTEGVPPSTIEQASSQAGYPAPVLQLSDELNMKLMRKIRVAAQEAAEAEGSGWGEHPSTGVIDRMLDEFDRPGKLEGKGFYEYGEDGKRTGLWKGLREAFPPVDDPSTLALRDLEERMLFIEVIETVKCLDEGVIETVADANIGSIMGIGFPGWTGGVLQYANGYEGGLSGFVGRARELAEKYGERFEPPASLVAKAEAGEQYFDTDRELTTA